MRRHTGWKLAPKLGRVVLPGPIFVVGFPKCGTTSLQHALESAGYGAVHCYAPKPWGPAAADRFVGHLMVEASAMGLAPLALLPGWVNAVTQMDCWWIEEVSEGPQLARSHFPQVTLLERLAESYPTAKFILNFRDTDSWLRSVATYGPMRQILREAEVPGLPSGEGGEDRELALWFEQHVERVRAYFAQRDPDALMEMRLEEGDEVLKARLEGFLGVEVTWGCHNTTTWA